MNTTSRIEFEFELFPFDSSRIKDPWETWYNIECDFSITIDGRVLSREIHICPVEFAVVASRWIRGLEDTPYDFVYQPEGYDPDYFVKFCRTGEGWKIVPFDAKYDEDRVFSEESIFGALQRFFFKLSEEITSKSGGKLDVASLISGGGTL